MSDVRLICWCLVLVTDRRGEESLESESDSSCVGHSLSATAALNDREKVGTPAYLTTKTSIKSVLCILCFCQRRGQDSAFCQVCNLFMCG